MCDQSSSVRHVVCAMAAMCFVLGCEQPVVTDSGSTTPEGAVFSYGAAARVYDSPNLGGDQQDCHWDASCDEGFVCIGVCQQAQPTPGVFAGPCDASGACQDGLECRAGSVCADPVALGEIYASWTQSEELLFDEMGLLELNQQLDTNESDVLQGPLPASSRLRNYLPPVGNQGGLGSCASWSVGYGMRGYQAAKLRGFWSASTEHLLSPTFLYTQLNTSCKGTNTGKNVDMLNEQGIPSLSVLPYVGLKAACEATLNDEIRDAAALNKSEGRITLFNKRAELTDSLGINAVINDQDMRKIKYTLFSGHPVVISIKTYKEFMQLGDDVLDSITKKNEGQHGYHAVVVVGYDDTSKEMTILNSWSPTWGDLGYGKISYDVFAKMTGAAFYSVPIAPPSSAPDEMPEPNASSSCDGVSNLTCSRDRSELQELCDGEVIATTTCTADEVCYLRGPNTGGPNVSGVAGCYSKQELFEHCGESNVVEECVAATSDAGPGKTQDVCFDTPLFTNTCPAGELCTTRGGSPECVDTMTLEEQCMGGLVRACDISVEEPGASFIEELCEDEVVRRIACRGGKTCAVNQAGEPECMTEDELALACDMGGYEQSCMNAPGLGPMIVSVCGGKIIAVEKRCDDPDLDGDDDTTCRRALSPDTRPTCVAKSGHALEVVLGWDGEHDLDLFVEQPGGVTLSYQRLQDDDTLGVYDASEACLPSSMSCVPGMAYKERVVWRAESMPESGTYSVQIANGRRDLAVPATITIYANDRVKFSGPITSPDKKGERSDAITFEL